MWMRAKIPLWGVNEEGVAHPILDENGRQKWVVGCMMEEGILVDEEGSNQLGADSLEEYMKVTETDGEVLGLTSTESAVASSSAVTVSTSSDTATVSANLFEVTVATDSAGVEWVELKKTTEEDKNKMKEIQFVGQPVAEAFVSTGMLRLFGIPVAEAIGKKFLVSYIIPDGLIPGIKGRLQSAEVEYRVAGVVEDETSNYYYFQIADAKRLGVKNYSQVKVIAKDQGLLPDIRKMIETLGFKTTSTVDTVAEIEKLFRNLRMILGFLGTIALAVASLGMFNTMTVSLLERTREVGVMKAMGMLSNEVRELFLAESMIMGVGGGMFGVIFGYLAGRLLSIILSSVSILKGQGIMDIAYVPWFFVVFILLISFVVGILTGWYPSKRARSISALNALRYE
jgi:ABC-type antimicrobial peptide transport system permease subunit